MWAINIQLLEYEGRSFNCGTWVLQGQLWDVTIFHSFQPVDLFLLDRNAVSSHKILAMYAAKQAFLGTPFRH